MDDIRTCIGCNQACIGRAHKGLGISCIQHPESGRELEYNDMPPVKRRKWVLVAGGGPAGMKAAAIAAARGHDVSLYEKSGQLGGQARLARLLPGRGEFGGIIDNLEREMASAGVNVVLGQNVDTDLIDATNPDTVILADGSQPACSRFRGCLRQPRAHCMGCFGRAGQCRVVCGDRGLAGRLDRPWTCGAVCQSRMFRHFVCEWRNGR